MMNSINNQLFYMLRTVATALGSDLRKRLVFVGGCTTALFITDKFTLEAVRATDDVDLIVDLAGYSEWAQLQEQLRQKGFSESPEDDVLCRMRYSGLIVDFMPDDEKILGFSNRWYAEGIKTAQTCLLSDDLEIRYLTPALFVATKLEAYAGRGNNDLFTSRDMEDILLIVDGREELNDEIKQSGEEICNYIAERFTNILAHKDFDYFLQGNIKGPEGRADIVRKRFVAISQNQAD